MKTTIRCVWCATETTYPISAATQTSSTPSTRASRMCDPTVRLAAPPPCNGHHCTSPNAATTRATGEPGGIGWVENAHSLPHHTPNARAHWPVGPRAARWACGAAHVTDPSRGTQGGTSAMPTCGAERAQHAPHGPVAITHTPPPPGGGGTVSAGWGGDACRPHAGGRGRVLALRRGAPLARTPAGHTCSREHDAHAEARGVGHRHGLREHRPDTPRLRGCQGAGRPCRLFRLLSHLKVPGPLGFFFFLGQKEKKIHWLSSLFF